MGNLVAGIMKLPKHSNPILPEIASELRVEKIEFLIHRGKLSNTWHLETEDSFPIQLPHSNLATTDQE